MILVLLKTWLDLVVRYLGTTDQECQGQVGRVAGAIDRSAGSNRAMGFQPSRSTPDAGRAG